MAPSVAHRSVTSALSVRVRLGTGKSRSVLRLTVAGTAMCARHPLTWGVRCKRRCEASKACSDLPTSGAYNHQFAAASAPHQLLIGCGSIPLLRTLGQRPSANPSVGVTATRFGIRKPPRPAWGGAPPRGSAS
uniref:Uncharacterized protein n=1 Tax=Rhodococcoides fascians D188 TaxID=1051973 RepID=G8JYW1_RHOFA|nr:hypothetical protein pFi_096 [Rhodococcus fascians D188]